MLERVCAVQRESELMLICMSDGLWNILLGHVSHIGVEFAGLTVGCAPIRIRFHE